MQPQIVTLIAAAAGIVGVFIGNYLAKSSQHEQWIRDNKRDEYRELLTTLTTSYGRIVMLDGPLMKTRENSPLDEVYLQAQMVFSNRLFINEDIDLAHLLTLWQDATTEYGKTYFISEFHNTYHQISTIIVAAAKKSFKR